MLNSGFDMLYEETRNIVKNDELVKSELENAVYSAGSDLLYDESSQEDNEDGSRYFTNPTQELGSS